MNKRLKRVLVSFSIPVLVLLGFLLGVRIWILWGIPDFPAPVDLEKIRAVTVAEEDNAGPVYREASELYQEPTETERQLILDLQQYDEWRESLPGLKDYLERNKQALDAWQQGTHCERYVPVPLATRSWLTETDDWWYRDFWRLALLRSVQLQTRGEHQQAWDWILAVLRNSRQFGHQGGILDRLYGNAAFTMATEMLSVWASDRGVSSELLQTAIVDLEEVWTHTPPTSVTLKCEYAMVERGLDGLHTLYEAEEENPSWGGTTAIRCFSWVLGHPEAAHRLVNFYVHNQLTAVDLPRYERPRRAGKAELFDEPSALTLDGISWSIDEFEEVYHSRRGVLGAAAIISASYVSDACDREQIRYEVGRLMLASQAYQRDHGQFPETLDKLVPEYLEAVPLDPFDGQPMKYRNDDEKVIYSVFRNENDDGGIVYDFEQVENNNDLKDYGMRLILRK